METELAKYDIAATTATTPKLRRTVEDQGIENYIREAERFLETARLNPDISERLGSYGFDDQELARGLSLQEAAQKAFTAHYGEKGSQNPANTTELTGRITEAREEFADFRLVARAAFTELKDRVNLRVVGDQPDDLQRFITAAFAGYEAADGEPYAAKFAKRGFPKAKLDALRQGLDVLATLDAAQVLAGTEATEAGNDGDKDDATATGSGQDETYLELKEYMKEIKGVARAAFRKRPESLAKLGLD